MGNRKNAPVVNLTDVRDEKQIEKALDTLEALGPTMRRIVLGNMLRDLARLQRAIGGDR